MRERGRLRVGAGESSARSIAGFAVDSRAVTPEILIVGDPARRRDLADAVTALGYAASLCQPRELNRRVRTSNPPTAILACMSDTDPDVLLAGLRRTRAGAGIPVMLYGRLGGNLRDLADVLDLGADHFLEEPASEGELREALLHYAGPATREPTPNRESPSAREGQAAREGTSRLGRPPSTPDSRGRTGRTERLDREGPDRASRSGRDPSEGTIRRLPRPGELAKSGEDERSPDVRAGTSRRARLPKEDSRRREPMLGDLHRTLDRLEARLRGREDSDPELAGLGLDSIPDVEPEHDALDDDELPLVTEIGDHLRGRGGEVYEPVRGDEPLPSYGRRASARELEERPLAARGTAAKRPDTTERLPERGPSERGRVARRDDAEPEQAGDPHGDPRTAESRSAVLLGRRPERAARPASSDRFSDPGERGEPWPSANPAPRTRAAEPTRSRPEPRRADPRADSMADLVGGLAREFERDDDREEDTGPAPPPDRLDRARSATAWVEPPTRSASSGRPVSTARATRPARPEERGARSSARGPDSPESTQSIRSSRRDLDSPESTQSIRSGRRGLDSPESTQSIRLGRRGLDEPEPERSARPSARAFEEPDLDRGRERARPSTTRSASRPAPRIDPTLREAGKLGEIDVPRLLWQLHGQRFTGRLRLHRQRVEKQLWLEAGELVFARSNAEQDRLIDGLLQRGVLTRSQYETARRLAAKEPRRAGQLLVDAGFLKPHELDLLLRDHLARVIDSSFSWTDGSWSTEPGERVDEAVLLDAPLALLLYEGVRHRFELDELDQLLRRSAGAGGSPSPRLLDARRIPELTEQLRLLPEEQALLARLDGRTSLAALVSEGADALDLHALVHVLEIMAAVELDVPPTERADEFGLATKGAHDPSEIDRERILERLRLAREADYFELLGLGRDAARSEIRHAHAQLSASFSDDVIEPQTRVRHALELSELRTALDEALDILGDDAMRSAYLAHMQEPE